MIHNVVAKLYGAVEPGTVYVDVQQNHHIAAFTREFLLESSNPGSTHIRSRTEFQSINVCGPSQSGLQSGLGAFILEVNPGSIRVRTLV